MTDFNNKEIAVSITKSLFSAVPYVGQLLNEIAFDYRGRIKQNRLNKFTDHLAEFFQTANEINIENLKTEEFSDLFESVLKRVTQTKSEEKQKRFRDILINQFQNPNHNIDNSETYLDLVTTLSEPEIQILKNHQIFDENYDVKETQLTEAQNKLLQKKERLEKEHNLSAKGYANNYLKVEHEIKELQSIVNLLTQDIKQLQVFRTPSFYNISKNDFLYYKQSLCSKALLIDNGIGAISVRPFEVMGITEFGKKFIQYIIK